MSFVGNQNVGVGTTTPNYHLDVSGNANISNNCYVNGTMYNGTSIIKQISSIAISSGFYTGTAYQNPYNTPIFVYMTLVTNVNANTFYNIYTGSTSSVNIFLGNGVLVTQNQWISFIVLPNSWWMITGSPLSIATVVYYY